jgi:hypothetical protein
VIANSLQSLRLDYGMASSETDPLFDDMARGGLVDVTTKPLGYNQRTALQRVASRGEVALISAGYNDGFNDRSTYFSLERRGLVRIEERPSSSGPRKIEWAILTERGRLWLEENQGKKR